jgi:hypothetical protein
LTICLISCTYALTLAVVCGPWQVGERVVVGRDVLQHGLGMVRQHGLEHAAVEVLHDQQLGDAELGLGQVEGQVEVLQVVVRVQLVVVEEVGVLAVDEGAEAHAVAPAG